ncbi:MAG: hypothetical protein WCT49_01235 [Candidatus Paceibacterota bacterium]|jgi:hypothetical protein|nr:hypothetical protein [Candidatus Paceibacterota bacterium]
MNTPLTNAVKKAVSLSLLDKLENKELDEKSVSDIAGDVEFLLDLSLKEEDVFHAIEKIMRKYEFLSDPLLRLDLQALCKTENN